MTQTIDPTLAIGPCGHGTTVYSAYYPLCSNCGFKAQQYAAAGNDATVTAADIASDRWHDAAEYANEAHEYDPDCDCDACEQTYADAQGNDDGRTNPVVVPDLSDLPFLEVDIAGEAADAVHDRKRPAWNARLAARAAAIVSASQGA